MAASKKMNKGGRGGELNSIERSAEEINTGKGGGKSPPVESQPRDDEHGDLAMRGMSSGDSAKHWKSTGYRVPKSAGESHTGRK